MRCFFSFFFELLYCLVEALNKFGRAKGRHCVFVEWIRPVGACKLTVLRLNPGGVVIFQTKKEEKKKEKESGWGSCKAHQK